jgi:hypothetical protein
MFYAIGNNDLGLFLYSITFDKNKKTWKTKVHDALICNKEEISSKVAWLEDKKLYYPLITHVIFQSSKYFILKKIIFPSLEKVFFKTEDIIPREGEASVWLKKCKDLYNAEILK